MINYALIIISQLDADVKLNRRCVLKIEDQVCSLELAKKLRELGVKQESVWRWIEYPDLTRIAGPEEFGFASTAKVYSAFTVAELGRMLVELVGVWPAPENIKLPRFQLLNGPDTGIWSVQEECYNTVLACAATEANSRGELVAFWIRNLEAMDLRVSWLNP